VDLHVWYQVQRGGVYSRGGAFAEINYWLLQMATVADDTSSIDEMTEENKKLRSFSTVP